MADMIEALGMQVVGMESSRARMVRSVCVVALGGVSGEPLRGWRGKGRWGGVPVWIPDDEEGYILCLGAFEDGIAI